MMAADTPCWILGTGFLGSRLRARLAQSVGVDAHAPAEVQGDAADPAVLLRAAALVQPQIVFCCLSTRGGDAAAYRRTYTEVLRALPAGARPVFCSALSAGGAQGERAAVLREAEQEALQRGGVVVRLAALYGPGRCELLRRHLSREPRLAGPPSRLLHYLHAEDAVSALLAAASAPCGIYAACGETLTHAEAYALMESLTGIPAAQEESLPGRRGRTHPAPEQSAPPVPHWAPQESFADFCRRHA